MKKRNNSDIRGLHMFAEKIIKSIDRDLFYIIDGLPSREVRGGEEVISKEQVKSAIRLLCMSKIDEVELLIPLNYKNKSYEQSTISK